MNIIELELDAHSLPALSGPADVAGAVGSEGRSQPTKAALRAAEKAVEWHQRIYGEGAILAWELFTANTAAIIDAETGLPKLIMSLERTLTLLANKNGETRESHLHCTKGCPYRRAELALALARGKA